MSEFLVRSAVLAGFDEAVEELNGDPETLLKQVGLLKAELTDPGYYFPYQHYVRLLNLSAQVLDFPFFGHLLSQHKGASHLGILGRIVETSKSPLDALQFLINYQHLQTRSAVSDMQIDNGILRWTHTVYCPCEEPLFQAYQNIIGVGLNVFRLLGGENVKPIICYSTFDKPVDDRYLRSAYQCPIQYNADFNGCSFPVVELEKPFDNADLLTNQRLQLRAQALTKQTAHLLELQLRDLIRQAVATGNPNIDWIAQQLRKNKRTLQRELDHHNLKFKVLLDDVRLETAKHHLSYSAMSLTQISNLLGYSDLSAFSRFFSKQCGLSPLQWRKRS